MHRADFIQPGIRDSRCEEVSKRAVATRQHTEHPFEALLVEDKLQSGIW